jgi:hypothetical protein
MMCRSGVRSIVTLLLATARSIMRLPLIAFRSSDLVNEFGVADYMKIAIEGNDRICIAGLTNAVVPTYISIEMDHAQGRPRYSKACRSGVSRLQGNMSEQLMAPGDPTEHVVLRAGPQTLYRSLCQAVQVGRSQSFARTKRRGVRSLGREDIRGLALLGSCPLCLELTPRT